MNISDLKKQMETFLDDTEAQIQSYQRQLYEIEGKLSSLNLQRQMLKCLIKKFEEVETNE